MLYQQIKKIERDYNSYKIDRVEANEKARPLIEKANLKSIKLANKYEQVPTIIRSSNFSFGK